METRQCIECGNWFVHADFQIAVDSYSLRCSACREAIERKTLEVYATR
jgi:hypothetical protein